MFTEDTIIEEIRITEDGLLLVAEVTVIYRDNFEIARSRPHRYVLDPGTDTDKPKPSKLDAVAKAIWTEEVVNRRKDKIAKVESSANLRSRS